MTTQLRRYLALIVFCLVAPLNAAQQFQAPAGWRWVPDQAVKIGAALDPAEGEWLFGTMAPGWHVTTRPGVVLFEPSYSAKGRFVIESEMFLFPGKSDAGYGLFVGGERLDGAPRYLAFLARRDGSVSVETVEGDRRTTVVPWTKASSVIAGAAIGEAVRNVLRVEAEAGTLSFLVNGTKVADTPRASVAADGVVGLRIGADLNLHVTNLNLTHRLALPRPVRPQP